jgi:hypothetical protein
VIGMVLAIVLRMDRRFDGWALGARGQTIAPSARRCRTVRPWLAAPCPTGVWSTSCRCNPKQPTAFIEISSLSAVMDAVSAGRALGIGRGRAAPETTLPRGVTRIWLLIRPLRYRRRSGLRSSGS